MIVHVDLGSKRATFEYNGQRISSPMCVTVTSQWMSALMPCTPIGDETYSVAWKTWQKEKQYVEVSKHNEGGRIPQEIIASWSYVARPECPVKHSGLEGSVRVTGSPYGDWYS